MPRSREEHLVWCKLRALGYLDRGDLKNAYTSMGSDLGKHPETIPSEILLQLGLMYLINKDSENLKSWIEGFR